jgi:hypothetical protein
MASEVLVDATATATAMDWKTRRRFTPPVLSKRSERPTAQKRTFGERRGNRAAPRAGMRPVDALADFLRMDLTCTRCDAGGDAGSASLAPS